MKSKISVPIVEGDRWRMELEIKTPGETFLVIFIDGEQQGRVPIGNVLEPHARHDPASADAREQLIAQLRGEVGDWKSKFYNRVGAEVELEQARAALAKAAEEIRVMREPARQAAHSVCEWAASLRVLVRACKKQLQRCERCKGSGEVPADHTAVDDGAGMPCPACAAFREYVDGIELPERGA